VDAPDAQVPGDRVKLLLCPCDREGCGRYRIGLPASALQEQEASLEIFLSEGLPVRLDLRTGKAIGLADRFGDWDVVVVQRPLADWQVQALRDCRERGIRTVVEVDDDFEALHHLAPAWGSTHPRVSAEWNRQWLRVACREADLVTVTTQALAARYAPHGRVAIIPNYVPEAWLSISRATEEDPSEDRLVVGWTGTVGTHQGDLAVTHGGVAAAVRETGATFRVIGNPELVRRDLSLDAEPENVPWQDWGNYAYEIARLDVGIAPLADTAFNRAKSALKPLEYAALGVPSVASSLPAYEALAARGIGILARDRSRDWRREVKRLLADDAYRAETSAAVRLVAAEHTIEGNAHRFAAAWTGEGYAGSAGASRTSSRRPRISQ
jgi:glycosyltransferase involved in cell wall biosynthesis